MSEENREKAYESDSAPRRKLGDKSEVGSLTKHDNIAAAVLAIIEMMKRFFNTEKPYRDNPESQNVTLGIIEELGKKSEESIEKGNYTEGYLYARQQAYFESFHEAIMSPEVTDKKTAVAVASSIAEEKIQEIDQKDFAQIAKNDYKDMSEAALAGVHNEVSSEVNAVIENNYAKAPQDMLKSVIGDDLNKLVDEKSSDTLSPAQKQNGLDQSMSNDMEDAPSKSKEVSINNERNMDSPSSGPGR